MIQRDAQVNMTIKKAVILLSGGLDSATCLAIAKQQGYLCYGLSFHYGQRHRAELQAARQLACQFECEAYEVVELGIGSLGGSALTDQTLTIHEYNPSSKIPNTYVPARNTIFFSIALGWAEILKADHIFCGISAVDYSNYPDCRPEYLSAWQTLAHLATRSGAMGKPIQFHAPLIYLNKAEIIQLGVQFGVNYGLTISCYQATEDGLACGICDSCVIRARGFENAGVPDPTRYHPHYVLKE